MPIVPRSMLQFVRTHTMNNNVYTNGNPFMPTVMFPLQGEVLFHCEGSVRQ